MKISYISDLHLINQNEVKIVTNNLKDERYVIFAGDISHDINRAINLLIKVRDMGKVVIYVPGNHEYWTHNIKYINNKLLEINEKNIHILINKSIIINDIKFIGAVGWIDGTNEEIFQWKHKGYKDFIYINDFNDFINQLKDVNFIKQESNSHDKCVVITHFVPYMELVNRWYRGDRLNPCFYNNWRKYFYDNSNIKYWVYGHNHTDNKEKIDDITFLSNGYHFKGINFKTFNIE